MKKTITLGLTVLALSAIGQYDKVTELMYFTDPSDKIQDYDLENDGMTPILIYSSGNDTEMKVSARYWNGDYWDAYGVFRDVEKPSAVNIEFDNDIAYALVRDGDYFSLYKKEGEKWNVYGTKDFATYKQLSDPTLTFFRGDPIIYDKIYGQESITMFKYKDGKISEFPITKQLGNLSDDFKIISNDPDKMVMAWSSGGADGKFHFFELKIGADNKTSQVEITKGLKVKDIKRIYNLFYKQSTLFMVYSTSGSMVKVAKLTKGAEKWEAVAEQAFYNTSNHYPTDDFSFVAKDKERASYNAPIFYHFNGRTWDEGVKIGSTYGSLMNGAQVTQGLLDYYIIYRNNLGKIVVKQVSDM